MRTKRKTYDYHSSDYGNEDYGHDEFEGDDFDDDELVGESDGDSAYGESGNERGPKQSHGTQKSIKSKNQAENYVDEEESFEDEDPFSPEIEVILADKQVELSSAEAAQCNFKFKVIPINRIQRCDAFLPPHQLSALG